MIEQKHSRRNRYKDGYDTVVRVVQYLNAKYGTCSATKLLATQVTQIDLGRNYEPDIEIYIPRHYGVEVKGMFTSWERDNGTRNVPSYLRLRTQQWLNLTEWCNRHNAKPLVIIEIKTRSKRIPYIYRKLNIEDMNKLLSQYKGNWITPNIWEILEIGEKL